MYLKSFDLHLHKIYHFMSWDSSVSKAAGYELVDYGLTAIGGRNLSLSSQLLYPDTL
jgi:hypothetical protein